MSTYVPISATTSLFVAARNTLVKALGLCAAAANSTLELFDGTIGTIATMAVGVGGTGYLVGDTLTLVQDGGGEQATALVATTDGLIGEILTAAINAAGTGYTANDVLTLVAVGGGTQATVRVDTVGGSGEITAITLLTGGENYVASSSYAVTGGTGNDDATITASTVAVGEVATITLADGGTGYDAGSTYATTTDSAAGADATVTASTITDAGTSIMKLAAVANESAPPFESDCGILTTDGLSVRITGTNAKGHLYHD